MGKCYETEWVLVRVFTVSLAGHFLGSHGVRDLNGLEGWLTYGGRYHGVYE